MHCLYILYCLSLRISSKIKYFFLHDMGGGVFFVIIIHITIGLK